MKPLPSTRILTTPDGYQLTATLFPATPSLKGRMVVAGATGVPQGFYKRFATYAAAHGFETLTFDFRGIGLSRPSQLKGFRMDLFDWFELDLATAVETMVQPGIPLYVVGHSQAGHAFGLLPNHTQVSGFYVFGTGAGWHGYMPRLEAVKVLFMWHVLLPMLTWIKGYCPGKMVGLGEDLPLGAYRQWRDWCRFPHYFLDDPKLPTIKEKFAQVRTPITAANALDDLWALPPSRDAFVHAYCNAPLTLLDLDPSIIGGKIGHMGYFRQAAQPLWENVLNWFSNLPNLTVPTQRS